MAKRMKLIPASLYEKLMKLQTEGLQSIPEEPILDSMLPDEVKITLYQEQKRNENKYNQIKKETPLLVKDVSKCTASFNRVVIYPA